MNYKQIFSTTTLLLLIPFFLLFPSCKFDSDLNEPMPVDSSIMIDNDDISPENMEEEDTVTIKTIVGPDSSIAKIWIDTNPKSITHAITGSDFEVQPVYELPEIENSGVTADAQQLEYLNHPTNFFINVFSELPNDAIGYQLEVEAANLPKNTKLMFRDMKASSKFVWIKNETPASITVQSTFAGCDTLEFHPDIIGENNGEAVSIPANGAHAFEMLSEPLKVNQLQLLLTEASDTGKLLVSFAIPGNCLRDDVCFSTYLVYTSCGAYAPKQILPDIALESVSKRAATDLKKPTLKLTSLYLLHKKELQHLFKNNAIVQTATAQFLEDHKIAITNMLVSESYVLKDEQIDAAEELLYTIEEQTNDNELQQTIIKLKEELKQVENQTLKQALEHANLSIE